MRPDAPATFYDIHAANAPRRRRFSRHTRVVDGAETHWTGPGAGRRYAGPRFRDERARSRDPDRVTRLLDRHGIRPSTVLDAPSGTGRLEPALASRCKDYIALDRSPSMLAEHPRGRRLLGSVQALPFADDRFDLVVCCRLLHHLEAEERRAVLAELVRVSRGWVLASFWDATSWHAWRRRSGLRRASRPDTRRACTRAQIGADLAAAGAQVRGFAASFRFVSPQTFVAARVEAR